MKQYDPATHVAVPKSELAKLEQSRVDLYEFLHNEEFIKPSSVPHYLRLNILGKITQQMWMVANRIKWED